MKKKTTITLVMVLMVLGLTACGNKGDLYLPDENNTSDNTEPSS